MAVPFLLIDGYNLLHAAGLARTTYGPGDLELCRNRMIVQLAARLGEHIVGRTTIVFDAFGRFDDSDRHQVRHGFRIVYAPAGTDADSEMERLIEAHDAPRQLLVVSSDHRLQRAAQRRRCQSTDSDVFWDGLEQQTESGASKTQTGPVFPGTDYWMSEFSDAESATRDDSGTGDDIFDADYLSDLESEAGE